MKNKKKNNKLNDIYNTNESNFLTVLRKDAFKLDDNTKIELIEENIKQIMLTLGLDLDNESLKDTPSRVAKMYINEIFSGLKKENKPSLTVFKNNYKYNEILIEKNISVNSICEHHFLPFIGKAHVAYISTGKIIGLSKINRIVDYYAKRPQVQERLTVQVLQEMKKTLETDDVAILIESKHLCVSMRGIKDANSTTITAKYSGKFNSTNYKNEFLGYINKDVKK